MNGVPVIPILLRNWRTIAIGTLVIGALSALGTLVLPNWYTATVQLAPETPQSGLSSLADRFGGLGAFAGLNLLGDRGGVRSARFYLSLLRTRPVRDSVLFRRYSRLGLSGALPSDSATLADIVTTGKPAHTERRRWRARQVLGNLTRASSDPRTDLIAIDVRMRSPQLAAAVAAAYAEELVAFNQTVRLSQTRATREFITTRVLEAEQDLKAAEDSLRAFVTGNREYTAAPTLVFEHTRLQRNLTVQEELYVNLRQRLDAARIAEKDDTPTLTLVEPAAVPAIKSWPKRTYMTLTATSMAAVLLSLVVVLRATGRLDVSKIVRSGT